MKDNGIKQRVTEVLRFKKINVNRASKILSIPQRTLNRQVNEDGNISMDLLYAILDNFTEISPLWLLLGEGDMIACQAEPSYNKAPYYNDLPVSAGFKDVLDGGRETPTSYISTILGCARLDAERASLWNLLTNFSSPDKSPLKTLTATLRSNIVS